MKTSLKILMVEDAPADVDLILHEITKSGIQFNAYVVTTKEEYVKALQVYQPDVILSDYTLEAFNGLQALSYREELAPGVPFILVTVSTNEQTAVQVMKAGADDYVIKEHITHIGTAIKTAIEKKEAEEKLRVFSRIVEQSPASVIVTNTHGTVEYVNQNYSRLTGYNMDEVVGRNLQGLKSVTNSPEVYRRLWDTIIAGSEYYGEFQNHKKNGEAYFEATSISPITDEKGVITHFVSTQEDITERKQTEKTVGTLCKAVEQSPLSIIITDVDGKIEYVNTRCEASMQNELNELKGTHPHVFNPELTPKDLYETMWKTLRSGNTWHDESMNLTKEGKMQWENVTIVPLTGENGKICNYIVTTEDITKKKRSQDELIAAKDKALESDRIKTALLNNISYKIRTPMNTISGFSDFLNNPDLDSEKRNQYIDLIRQSSNQLLSIITDVVNITNIEAGHDTIHEKAINLNSFIKQINEQFNSKIQIQEVVLRHKTGLTDDNSYIFTDETRLTQVLSNLVENALKFTMRGYVEFGYTQKNDFLEFYVEDTGIGIPAEIREELLNQYHQLDLITNGKYGDSGLGLPISKAYTELLGGTLWFTSEQGKGSKFYFTIPYKKCTKLDLPEKQPHTELVHDFEKPVTMLVVEDEDLNFKLMLMMLSKMGMKTIRAKNGQEAVDICKANKNIDLVLMDIKMPIMDGYEATKRLKAILPDLPVIVQTAYASYENQEKAAACGCSDFISKPFNKEQLKNKINEQLWHHQ
jgi:PAS domain S-box-containing protein